MAAVSRHHVLILLLLTACSRGARRFDAGTVHGFAGGDGIGALHRAGR